MGTFTGTNGADTISPALVSAGVLANPPNAKPGLNPDTVTAGGGADTVFGAGGNDNISGEAGNDTLDGGLDGDLIQGGDNNDRLIGGGGNDDLRGDAGADSIDGGVDNDFIQGGAGNDTLVGGVGNDDLRGGDENDFYQFIGNWGNDFIRAQATTGKDFIEILGAVDPATVKFRIENDDLIITRGANSIFVENQFAAGVGLANTLVRQVEFDDGTIIPITNPDPAWLNRVGTANNDFITGSKFNDTVDGRAGNDVINGFEGNDILNGGTGNDNISGFSGNDTITGGSGDDFASGGEGNDRYLVSKPWGSDTYTEQVGQGTDIVEFGPGIAPGDLDIFVEFSDLVINLGASRVRLSQQFASGTGANARFEKLGFAVAADQLIRLVDSDWLERTGKIAGETFNGSIFKDTLDGGGGNDVISGRENNDVLNGGVGNDNVSGDAGNDTITGGKGDDRLNGGTENDRFLFETGWGKDTIGENQSQGTDIVQFGPGILPADLKFRVEGSTLIFQDGPSSIQIDSQFFNGTGVNARVERIQFNNGDTLSLTKALDAWLTRTGTGGADFFGGSIFGDTIDGLGGDDNINGQAGRDSLTGGVANDVINGGDDNDSLDGSAGNDFLRGDNGRDVLIGGAGTDSLTGGADNDSMDGGTSNDTLDGSAGVDTMRGGVGADSLVGSDDRDFFRFQPGDGSDVIGNFALLDRLQFTGFGAAFDTAAELLAAADQNGPNVRIDVGTGVTAVHVTILAFGVNSLTESQFLT